jgi:hypothetical protein
MTEKGVGIQGRFSVPMSLPRHSTPKSVPATKPAIEYSLTSNVRQSYPPKPSLRRYGNVDPNGNAHSREGISRQRLPKQRLPSHSSTDSMDEPVNSRCSHMAHGKRRARSTDTSDTLELLDRSATPPRIPLQELEISQSSRYMRNRSQLGDLSSLILFERQRIPALQRQDAVADCTKWFARLQRNERQRNLQESRWTAAPPPTHPCAYNFKNRDKMGLPQPIYRLVSSDFDQEKPERFTPPITELHLPNPEMASTVDSQENGRLIGTFFRNICLWFDVMNKDGKSRLNAFAFALRDNEHQTMYENLRSPELTLWDVQEAFMRAYAPIRTSPCFGKQSILVYQKEEESVSRYAMMVERRVHSVLWDCDDDEFCMNEMSKAFVTGLLPHLREVCYAANPLPPTFPLLIEFAVIKEAQMQMTNRPNPDSEQRTASTSQAAPTKAGNASQQEAMIYSQQVAPVQSGADLVTQLQQHNQATMGKLVVNMLGVLKQAHSQGTLKSNDSVPKGYSPSVTKKENHCLIKNRDSQCYNCTEYGHLARACPQGHNRQLIEEVRDNSRQQADGQFCTHCEAHRSHSEKCHFRQQSQKLVRQRQYVPERTPRPQLQKSSFVSAQSPNQPTRSVRFQLNGERLLKRSASDKLPQENVSRHNALDTPFATVLRSVASRKDDRPFTNFTREKASAIHPTGVNLPSIYLSNATNASRQEVHKESPPTRFAKPIRRA